MNLSIGIVGLPNVGKSTMFNALTKKSVPAENYPFCTIDPSVGIVAVPDNRLARLSDISGSEKIIPAVVEFTDIAGLVEGASKGEGLGNKFLHNIREVDAILHMVRIFSLTDKSGKAVNHVYGKINPLHDIEVITMELVLADLVTVESRVEKNAKEVKRGNKDVVREQELLVRIQRVLAMGKPANTLDFDEEEMLVLKSLHLLTIKPVLFCLNKSSEFDNLDETDSEKFSEITGYINGIGSEYVVVDAGMENDLKDMEGDEKQLFRAELGGSEDGIDNMIQSAYKLLGLMSYFTTGVKETHAWTVNVGSTAPEAGRAIHNDFADKFIRAQVVAFADLDNMGSKSEARNVGKLRTEGRDYIVQDGDVIEFLV